MNLEQLRYFKEICTTHSLNKAAERLFITQPALSKSMSALENSLGVKLLVRDKKGVFPTKAGEIFLSAANQILSTYDDALQKITNTITFSKPFTIYAFPVLTNIYGPILFKNLHNNFCNMTVRFHEIFPYEISTVTHDPFSLAFVCGGKELDSFTTSFPEYISTPIKCEPLFAFVSSHSSWTVQTVNDNTLIQNRVSFRNFDNYNHFYPNSYPQSNYTNNTAVSEELLLHQDGIQILPYSIGKHLYTNPDIIAIPLDKQILITHSILFHSNLLDSEFAPVIKYLISLLKNVLMTETLS